MAKSGCLFDHFAEKIWSVNGFDLTNTRFENPKVKTVIGWHPAHAHRPDVLVNRCKYSSALCSGVS
jgi:hypothetical protein